VPVELEDVLLEVLEELVDVLLEVPVEVEDVSSEVPVDPVRPVEPELPADLVVSPADLVARPAEMRVKMLKNPKSGVVEVVSLRLASLRVARVRKPQVHGTNI
jgi:hypothetical protein